MITCVTVWLNVATVVGREGREEVVLTGARRCVHDASPMTPRDVREPARQVRRTGRLRGEGRRIPDDTRRSSHARHASTNPTRMRLLADRTQRKNSRLLFAEDEIDARVANGDDGDPFSGADQSIEHRIAGQHRSLSTDSVLTRTTSIEKRSRRAPLEGTSIRAPPRACTSGAIARVGWIASRARGNRTRPGSRREPSVPEDATNKGHRAHPSEQGPAPGYSSACRALARRLSNQVSPRVYSASCRTTEERVHGAKYRRATKANGVS